MRRRGGAGAHGLWTSGDGRLSREAWRWWLRFLLWSAVLFPLSWLGLDAWHRTLAPVVTGLLYALGFPFEVRSFELLGPYEIAFFLAMVLATRSASRAERWRAALIGVAGLVVVEIGIATLAIVVMLRESTGHPFPPAIVALRDGIAASYPWVVAPGAWMALLGQVLASRRANGRLG